MNIFFLDEDPKNAALSLCDKHIVKMILETAQMCSTAIQQSFELEPLPSTYKPAFVNHPMTLWVGESHENMQWALRHGLSIGKEYTHRYEKTHKSQKVLEDICEHYFPIMDEPFKITTPPLCMPDHCTSDIDVYRIHYVDCYRKYYIISKKSFAKYTKRPMPEWLEENDEYES